LLGCERDPLPVHGGDLQWAAAVAHCRPDEIVDFSASINPLGPPEAVRTAWQHSLDLVRHYPDPHCRQLRDALAAHFGLAPESIVCGNGAAELIGLAARDLAAGGTTLLPIPAFGDYRRALTAAGAQVTELPLSPDSRLPERLPTADGLLIANPHNPSGRLYGRSEILALCADYPLVVVDEAFMDFVSPEASCLSAVAERPNLVVIRSLTKFYSLPGLRLGFAAVSAERRVRWQGWRDPWSVNALAQALGVCALGDRNFAERTWQWLATERPRLAAGLDRLPGLRVLPGAANFLLVETATSALVLQRALLVGHRLLIRHCTSFPGLGERYFRVAVRSSAENERLLGALASVLETGR
jgi:L-threonine-O-3-phosphate decarboxylase